MISRIFNKNYKLFLLAVFLLLGILIYSNTFRSTFHYDDNESIVNNFAVRTAWNLRAIWNFWPTRFITYLTVAFNYTLGRLDVFSYHIFNLAVHLGSAILVCWLMLLSFAAPAMKGKRIAAHAKLFAFFAGLVFLAHPVQTQAVTYIIQRATSLATLFYLASLCLYVKSRLLQKHGDIPKVFRTFYYGSLVAAVMAMFTKEIAITLPLMIVFYEFCFLKEKERLNWKYLIPILATMLIIPLVMFLTKDVDFIGMRRIQEAPAGISPWHYLLSELRVTVTYLRLLFLPVNQNLDYDYHAAKSLLELPILTSLILLVFILIIAARLFSKYRVISFGIFCFFLTLLPESSVIPIRDLIFEHRLYLPMVGFSIFLVGLIYYLFENKSLKITVVILLVITFCYSVLAYKRNFIWEDELSLWSDTVAKSPKKTRAYYNRGFAYQNLGDFTKAFSDYNKAIELDPDDASAFYIRGFAYQIKGDPDRAILDYSRTVELDPKYVIAYNNRGFVYQSQGKSDLAILDYNKAIELNPKYVTAYNNRGLIYQNQRKLELAILDYNKIIEINPAYSRAYYNRGLVYQNQGKLEPAILDYSRAIKLNINHATAYNNRGLAYQGLGKFDLAIHDFNKAIELNPKNTQAYYNRGLAYASIGDLNQAILDYNKAIELNPGYAAAYNNRGLAYEDQGNTDQAILDYSKTIELIPDSPLAHNNRATAYFLKKDYDRAWQDLHKAEALGYKADPGFVGELKKASGRER